MKLKRLFLFIVILIPILINAQYEEKEKLRPGERFFFGGNFSLQIGTTTFIELSPIAGYKITPRLSAGVGLIYQYYRERILFDSTRTFVKTSIFGGRLFTQFTLVNDIDEYIPLGLHAGIIAYTEYEFLNLESFNTSFESVGRYWLDNYYIGGGLELPISERMSMNLLVLWNLNQNESMNYSNPSVRIGFVFFPFKKK